MFGFLDRRKIADTPTGWFLLALVVLFVAWCIYRKAATTDSYVVWNFHRHKADYEKLRVMLDHDRVLSFINSGQTTPEDPARHGITAERIAEYRSDMSRINCGAIRYTPDATLFVTDAWGTSSDILFFPHPPPLPPHSYRHLEGDWYLAYGDDS